MKATGKADGKEHWPGAPMGREAFTWRTHRRWLIALFCLLGVILLAPVWTVHYPPVIDYPNHLASTFVLVHLNDPAFQFSKFYGPNWGLTPYLVMDLILVALQKFLPAMLAGRLFLSLCLLVVPLSAWFFLHQANPGEDNLAFWALLLCSNTYFFLYGLLSLQLAFALCFLVLGIWLRYLAQPRPALWWLLLGLTTGLYFTHLYGFCVAGLVVTVYLFSARRHLSEDLRSWSLFLPGTLLFLYWKSSESQNWAVHFQGMGWKIKHLVAIMRGYSTTLDFVTLLTLAGCVLCGAMDNPKFRWNGRWLVVLGSLFAAYLVLPTNYGTATMVARRLLPFMFVIALVGAKVGRRGIYFVPIALALFVVRAANVEITFRAMQPQLENLARSFEIIPKNAHVLPIVLHKDENPLPEDHFWAYGVIKRGWFSPYLFHDKGVHPFRVRLNTYVMGKTAAYFPSNGKQPKWKRVQADYNYLWTYKLAILPPALAKTSKLVFDSGGLRVFNLDHQEGKIVTRKH